MRHALRIFLLTLALILIALALTPRATPAQATDPCDPNREIPYGWHLRPAQPCDGDSVTVVFTSCRPCVEILGYEWQDLALPLRLDLRLLESCLVTACIPDSLEVPLGRLAVGNHRLDYRVRVGVVFDDSGFCYVERPDSLGFVVGCPEPPLPPLPFVTRIRIGPPPPCTDCLPRICRDEPIPFRVEGTLPSDCYQFRKLELLPSPVAGPLPQPPVVRIVVAENDCMGWPCVGVATRWEAGALLPGLLPGAYRLMVQLDVVSMCDSTHVSASYRGDLAFAVKDSCATPPPEPCVWVDWVHTDARCDDFIGPDGRAEVTMTLTSGVPLAGLQGAVGVYPPGLLIADLKPVGRAEGMHIAWERTPEGAKFLMFSEQGAPIGGLRCDPGVRCVEPVLAVSLVPGANAVLPPVTHLVAHSLLGSDSLGNAVPACQIMTLVVVEARICAGVSCDFNLDGWLDIRDLVSMVRCVLGTGPCPDTSLARLDCNQDGRLGVDDVLCCARVILRDGERDTLPGRPEPGVAVQIGEPEWEAGGLRVPVRVLNADRVGAARLALALPLDRYEVTGVELAAANPDWLALNEVVDGQLVLGLIGLGPADPAEVAQALELGLRLALKPGQAAGGEIGLADAQLSGPDGVTLEIAASPIPVPLPLPGALMLSAARPNPFTHETSFALNLDRATDVDLSVHDLSGRRVATLFRGALGVGPHEFAWRGTRGDGSSAANGIYFLQARLGAERLARKVIFLRGN